jgi:hypothetical protein
LSFISFSMDIDFSAVIDCSATVSFLHILVDVVIRIESCSVHSMPSNGEEWGFANF